MQSSSPSTIRHIDAGAGVTTPPPSITVSRQHSFSTGRSSLSNPIPTSNQNSSPGRNYNISTTQYSLNNGNGHGDRIGAGSPRRHIFDTTNPFATLPRTRTLEPIRSGSSSPQDDRISGEAGRPEVRGRLMSFEDMLGGGPPGRDGPDRRSGSGSGR